MIITKADMVERTRIAANVNVDTYILDAHTYDLPTLLSGKLIREVSALAITYAAWSTETAYTTGIYAEENGFIWKALTDHSGSIPTPTNTNWEVDINATLRYLHLKDFLCWSAARRFRLEHGANYTEAGFTVPTDPQGTYQPGSDKRRADLIADARDKANFHGARIERFLTDNNMITRTSCTTTRTRGNGRVNAI